MKRLILVFVLLLASFSYAAFSETPDTAKSDQIDIYAGYGMDPDENYNKYFYLGASFWASPMTNPYTFFFSMEFIGGFDGAKDFSCVNFKPGARLALINSSVISVRADIVTGITSIRLPGTNKDEMGILSELRIGLEYKCFTFEIAQDYLSTKNFAGNISKIGLRYSFK